MLMYVVKPTLVFRHPQSGLKNVFSEPMSSWTWCMILIVTLIAALLAAISITLESNGKLQANYVRTLVISIAIICQQGLTENLGKTATKITTLTLILFSAILYQFYSSYIVGSLLTKAPKTINTLRHLVDSDLEVGVEETFYNRELINITTDETLKELYAKKIQKQNNFYNASFGINLIQKGGWAFSIDTTYGYRMMKSQLTEEEICELHEMPLFKDRPIFTTSLKHSPYREFVKVGVRRIQEAGILNYHYQKLTSTKLQCNDDSISYIKSVDLSQAISAFVLLLSAIAGSLLIWGLETFYFKVFCKKQMENYLGDRDESSPEPEIEM